MPHRAHVGSFSSLFHFLECVCFQGDSNTTIVHDHQNINNNHVAVWCYAKLKGLQDSNIKTANTAKTSAETVFFRVVIMAHCRIPIIMLMFIILSLYYS